MPSRTPLPAGCSRSWHRPGLPSLLLEDVHWADEATLDVLRIVGRRIESVPAVLVVSYRDDELDRSHPLRSVLGELPSRGFVRRLGVRASRAKRWRPWPSPRASTLTSCSRGQAATRFSSPRCSAPASTDVPDTIRDAVLARTARLDAPAQALLDAVAIFPRRTELWLLEAVASPASDQLEACLRTGVLRSDRDAIAFRHELARLVVEESIAPDQALALHRRALVALAEPPLASRT